MRQTRRILLIAATAALIVACVACLNRWAWICAGQGIKYSKTSWRPPPTIWKARWGGVGFGGPSRFDPPMWLATACPAVLLVTILIAATWMRRCPSLPGHCVNCGYDLRGTPDRCPECGGSGGIGYRQ